MEKLSGYVEVRISKTGGKEDVTDSIPSTEFKLEDGGDWSRDGNGEWSAGFRYIAFCDGFDLILRMSACGNRLAHYDLSVREDDLDKFDIKEVTINEDELDFNWEPPSSAE